MGEIFLLKHCDPASIEALQNLLESDSSQMCIHHTNMEEAKLVLERLKAVSAEGVEEMAGDGSFASGRRFAPGAIIWTTFRSRWWPARVSLD